MAQNMCGPPDLWSRHEILLIIRECFFCSFLEKENLKERHHTQFVILVKRTNTIFQRMWELAGHKRFWYERDTKLAFWRVLQTACEVIARAKFYFAPTPWGTFRYRLNYSEKFGTDRIVGHVFMFSDPDINQTFGQDNTSVSFALVSHNMICVCVCVCLAKDNHAEFKSRLLHYLRYRLTHAKVPAWNRRKVKV